MQVRRVKESPAGTRIVFVRDADPAIPDFNAAHGEVAVRYRDDRTLVYVGLGAGDGEDPGGCVRGGAASAVRMAGGLGRTAVVLELGSLPQHLHEAALEGGVLGTYAFDQFVREKPPGVSRIDLQGHSLSASVVREVVCRCKAVFTARDLVNGNAGDITPAALARHARALGRQGAMTVSVMDEAGMRRNGLGLLAAVGQGSPFPPRLIVMEYRGGKQGGVRTALVGKGITFDSGGLNLKPTGSIETMRCDMAGGATVMGVMQALAALEAPVTVLGVCAAAHNAIDATGYFCGDVYRACDGTTVEIGNTDAEGRLVLADAIAWIRRTWRPDRIVDLATLTGGMLTALGDVAAGLFSNNDALACALLESARCTGERLWRFPLYREYREALKGERADLRNSASFKRGHAGPPVGASFIGHFAGDTPWAHLDIAGTAYNEREPRGEIPKMGTGFGVRLLLDMLQREKPGSYHGP